MAAKLDQKIRSYKLYSANSYSTVCELSEPVLSEVALLQPLQNRQFITYAGIVTGNKESASGIYMVDKKVKLVLTHICLVSNIPIFEKGQKIKITNAHFELCHEPSKILWACARTAVFKVCNEMASNTFNRNQKLRLYDKEELTKQKSDPILNLCHDWNLNVSEVLILSEIYHNYYYKKFKNIFTDYSLSSMKYFLSVLKLCGITKTCKMQSRCLITEFLSVPHECGPWIAEERNSDIIKNTDDMKQCLITLAEFLSFMADKLLLKKEVLKTKYVKSDFQYDYCEVTFEEIRRDITFLLREKANLMNNDQENDSTTSLKLIGILDVDIKTG